MRIEDGNVIMTLKEFNRMMGTSDKLVTREKFMKKYNKELAKDDHGKLYGHDVTIHWNGMFCSVSDGATAYNHIICGLEDAMTELSEFD